MSKPLSCRYTGIARPVLRAALVDAEVDAMAEVRPGVMQRKGVAYSGVSHNGGYHIYLHSTAGSETQQQEGFKVQGRGDFKVQGGGASRFRAGGGFKVQGRGGGVLRIKAQGLGSRTMLCESGS